MFHDLFSNKWILGGISLLMIIAGVCYFWDQHTRAQYEREAAETADVVRQWELLQKLKRTRQTEHAPKVTAYSTTQTYEKPIITADAEVSKNTKAEIQAQQNETLVETAAVGEVRVSPYGFGPYPEVPAGMSMNTFPAPSANHELMRRVRIELLSQGINVVGATMEDGIVYPVIKGIGYVKWDSYWRPTGKVTYISRYKGHSEDGARLESIRFNKKKGKSLTRADVPPDIKLISFEEGGIDPYQFLDLP